MRQHYIGLVANLEQAAYIQNLLIPSCIHTASEEYILLQSVLAYPRINALTVMSGKKVMLNDISSY